MKYILPLLLLIFLCGCSNTATRTAENIGSGVKKCCASLSLPKSVVSVCASGRQPEAEPVSIIAISVLESSSQMLTW